MLIKKNVTLLSLIFGFLLVGFFVLKSPGDLSFTTFFNNVADKFSNLVNPASQVSLPLVSTNDPTPRIAYWWGKVNQHVDNAGFWRPDPDGESGADLDKLDYCLKWYPNTISIRDYKVETITNWKRSIYYEQSDYIRVTTSIECVQSVLSPVVTPPVVQVQNPPVVTISANPTPAQYGGVIDITWNVSNATSCVASNGWTGGKNANGGYQSIGNMTASTTFILTCTGPGGTGTNSVYVPVSQQVQVQNPPVNNNNVTLVTSPVDNTQKACPVFTKYLKKGDINNDRQEVILWQAFLNKYEGFNLVLDGLYGGKTEIAIRAFQTKYKQYVLIPWGITEATGYTYKTTRAYANFLLGCPEGSILLENGNVINFR